MLALFYTVTTDDVDGDGVLNSTEIGIGTDPEVFNPFNGYVDPNTFTYAFNLYDQWDEYLLSSYQAEVYSEVSAGNATYWRPLVPNSEGSIIYKFDFPKNISSAKVRANLYAWTEGADVNFDSSARAYLEASRDGLNWNLISESTPPNAREVEDIVDISEIVSGSKEIFIRARLIGSRSWFNDGLIFSQFLRSHPSGKESFAINVSLTPETPSPSYVDNTGSTQVILTTSGELHRYSGPNLTPGVRLTSIWLNFSDLSDIDLSGSRLIDLGIREANLTNANLSKANLRSSTLSGTNLSGANLTEAILTNTEISKNTNFANVTLDGVISGNINYVSEIPLATLPVNYILKNGYIVGPKVNLAGADFTNIDLSGANLSGANLSFANLSGANLSNTNLTGLNLINADLSNADLSGADLSDADLSYADLSGTDLSNVNLSNVYLGNVKLTDTILTDLLIEDIKEKSKINHILHPVEQSRVSTGNFVNNGDGTISSKMALNFKLNYNKYKNEFEVVVFDKKPIDISVNSNSINLRWSSNNNKYYSVWHTDSLDLPYKPLNNAYKIKNLNNFTLPKSKVDGFYMIKESENNNIFGDYNALILSNEIDGANVRILEDTLYSDTNEEWYSEYLDLIILNSNEYMIIENDGDLLYGEYTIDDISESDTEILLKNNTLFDKPGSKIESLDQRSYNLSFPSNSPKETLVIAPDLSYSDSYTRTKYEFELPSGQMPKSLIGKKMKIYMFSSGSDFCGYTEIDFDSVDDNSAMLKIGSGFTPVNVFYKLKTDSAANLIVNGVSPMLVKYPNLSTPGPLYIEQISDVRFTADLNLYAKDSECGFFFGHYITEVNPTIENIIYGYYGENSIPVDHIYGYNIDELVMVEDQNGDGIITKVDAEIYAQENNVNFIYPNFNFSDLVWGTTPIDYDDPGIRIISPAQ